jgi:ABC-2 type transport system permease protein
MLGKNSTLLFTPMFTLLQRELVRLSRHPVRIWTFLLSPLLLAVAASSGIGNGVIIPGLEGKQDLASYFFPSLVVLSVILTTINAPVSVLEDRRDGFLQSVLVAPISYSSVVFSKVIAATMMGLIQASLLTAFAPMIGIPLNPVSVVVIIVVLLVIGVGFASLGFLIAWISESAASFHAITGMLVLPLWLLGNGIAPLPADSWLKFTDAANPIAFAITTLRTAFVPMDTSEASALLTAPALFGCLIFALALLPISYATLKLRIKTAW